VNPLLRAAYAATAKLATAAAALVPPSDGKLALTFRARRGLRKRYVAWSAVSRDRDRPLLWMHAPSVGEGLMARPVLTLVRERRPRTQLAYTFFSPSAEDFSRGLDVDFRDFLPFDDPGEMAAALDALRPTALVFSKLDVWPVLVHEAKARGVRLGMISASLPPQSHRLRGLGRLMLHDAYAALDAVGAVDEDTAVRLVQLGVRPDAVVVTGDTRYDQVWLRAERVDRDAGLVARLASDRPTLVAGSTWPADEAPLLEALARVHKRVPGFRMILAPHEVTPEHLDPLVRWAASSRLILARLDQPDASQADVVLVDRYGVLGDLYALANVAFVGGGFHDAGLHSVLEPAAFGVPVVFGPRHTRSRDALELLRRHGAESAATARDIERVLVAWLEEPDRLTAAGANARGVIEAGRGAADRSLALVERLLA
jgi:3-deoxy-D-manno-octulosonic-acid transferase